MPKVKTHKGAAKRFYITGTGKLRRRKGLISHLRRKKPKAVRRQYSSKLPLSKGYEQKVKRLLPNRG